MYASIASMELSHLTIQPCEICLFFPFSLRETEWSSLRLSSSGLQARSQTQTPKSQHLNTCDVVSWLKVLPAFTIHMLPNICLVIFNICVHRCCLSSSNCYIHSTKIYWDPVFHALLTTRRKSILQSLYKLKADAFSRYMDTPEIWVSSKLITISTQQV